MGRRSTTQRVFHCCYLGVSLAVLPTYVVGSLVLSGFGRGPGLLAFSCGLAVTGSLFRTGWQLVLSPNERKVVKPALRLDPALELLRSLIPAKHGGQADRVPAIPAPHSKACPSVSFDPSSSGERLLLGKTDQTPATPS